MTCGAAPGSPAAEPARAGGGEAVHQLASRLTERLGASNVRRDAPLAPWTTFRVGGAAALAVEVHTRDHLRVAFREAAGLGVPVVVLGGGSNILVSDRGVPGLVLRIRLRTVSPDGLAGVLAESGVTMNGLVRWTIARGLGGLERWAGTPGTVGGAICGNAHFAGQLIGDTVDSVDVLTPDGEERRLSRDDMDFGYDRSRVQSSGEVVIAARFWLTPGLSPDALRERARESLAVRKRTQPLDAPSAGCVFQNPVPGLDPVPDGMPFSAGALIDRAGLKGSRVGGAVVSPVHANFIVAEPGACASDVRALIERCRRGVRDAFGVDLREEIRYIGDVGDE